MTEFAAPDHQDEKLPAERMFSRVRDQQEIEQRLRERFTAAEAFGRHLVPNDPSFVDDLWLHLRSPAPFATKHPDWYLRRWHTDINDPGLDWNAQDINPWSHLQDCLGIRGLVIVVSPDATPTEIMAALDASRVVLTEPPARWAWVNAQMLVCDTEEFLAMASRRIHALTNRVLVQLYDFWTDSYVLTTLAWDDVPALMALARDADIYDEGLRIMGT